MPYLIFIIGLLIGIYAFYRYFITARPDDIKSFFANGFVGLYILFLLFLAFSGRILIALGFLVLAMPFVISNYKSRVKEKDNNHCNDEYSDTDKKS